MGPATVSCRLLISLVLFVERWFRRWVPFACRDAVLVPAVVQCLDLDDHRALVDILYIEIRPG